MTTVNTSSDVITFDNYTWSDASFVWERPETNWLTYSYTAHSLDVIEAFHLADNLKKNVTYKYSDSLLLSDTNSNVANFVRSFVENSFNFSDIISAEFTSVEQDSLLLSDVQKVNLSHNLYDDFLLSDNYKQGLTKLLAEISHLSDAYAVNFIQKNLDNYLFSDVLKSTFTKKESVNMLLSESLRNLFTTKLADTLLLSDGYGSTFNKKLFDDLLLSDAYRNFFVSKFPELFNFVDVLNNLCNFNKTYYDDFLLTDVLKNNINKKLYDDFLVSDSFKRGFDFSISNLGIKTTDLTLDSFNESFNSPFGYSPFQEFVVGEYEYEKAIFRTTIISQDNTVNTAINKLNIHVDIPDTNDRGSVSIPATNTFVPFHKVYYLKPEVHVNINGGIAGQVMIPHITDITPTGFYIELRDLSNVLVSGLISWSSNGY